MGTPLTGLEIRDTYDALIKITDNGPIGATAKLLSDGLGNDSVLTLSTTSVGVGGDTSGTVSGVTINAKFCVKSEGTVSGAGFVYANDTTAANGSVIYACRSRGTIASPTAVVSGDRLASLIFAGNDGTDLALAAQINIEADGTVGANDMPGRITFLTTPDGTQAPTEKMRITNAGNVGIGTDAPAVKLHVSAPAGADAKFLLENGGAQSVLWTTRNSATNGDLRFQTMIGGTVDTRMLIDYSGNVGIGTSSPAQKLHVSDSGAVGINVTSSASQAFMNFTSVNTAGFEPFIGFGGTSAGDQAQMIGVVNGGVRWTVAGSERMRITAAGNVGIGTSAPAYPLDVVGSAQLSGELYMGNNQFLRFVRNSGSTSIQTLGIPSGTDDVRLLTTGDFNVVTGGLSTLMTVKSTGNVGIGTSSPTNVLDLGPSPLGRALTWANSSNLFSSYSAGALVLSSNFYGSTSSDTYLTSNTATFGAAGIRLGATDGGANSGLIRFFTDPAAAKTAGAAFTPSERMRIDASGNVGIGTTTPFSLLDIENSAGSTITIGTAAAAGSQASKKFTTINFAGFNNISMAQIQSWDESSSTGQGNLTFSTYTGSALTEKLRVTYAGNVGIGTSSPSEPLVVSSALRDYTSAEFSALLQSTTAQSVGRGASIGLGGETGGGVLSFGAIIGAKENSVFAETGGYLAFTTRANGGPLTEKVRILSSGGITFNGDTAAANALDDYEEGTWTISADPSSSGTITLDSGVNAGSYTKIGRQVTVTGLAEVSAVSLPVGSIVVFSGLPFPISSRNLDYDSRIGGSITVSSAGIIVPRAFAGFENQSSFNVYVDASTIAAGNQFLISFTYIV
jgi:hypothetical protein